MVLPRLWLVPLMISILLGMLAAGPKKIRAVSYCVLSGLILVAAMLVPVACSLGSIYWANAFFGACALLLAAAWPFFSFSIARTFLSSATTQREKRCQIFFLWVFMCSFGCVWSALCAIALWEWWHWPVD